MSLQNQCLLILSLAKSAVGRSSKHSKAIQLKNVFAEQQKSDLAVA